MADAANPTDSGEQAAADTPSFAIQRLYLKDSSFEAPNTPHIFREKWEPQVELELNTSSAQIAEGVQEVVLRLLVTAKVSDKTAFLIDMQYAGVFTIANFPDDQVRQMLGSYCPNIIFPYAREAVSDVVIRGGFPQLALAPVNFDALYAQHLEKQQAEANAADSTVN